MTDTRSGIVAFEPIRDTFYFYTKYSARFCKDLIAATYGKQHHCQKVPAEHLHFNTFEDGTPNLKIESVHDIQGYNGDGGANVVFCSGGWRTLGELEMQRCFIHVLAETSNVRSMAVVSLFDPFATMERVCKEGEIATENVDAHWWRCLPVLANGAKVHRILFDHHTLQNRFYFSGGNTHVLFESAMPLLQKSCAENGVQSIVFPDEGARKRFQGYFAGEKYEHVTCGKTRIKDSQKKVVVITDGLPAVRGKCVAIVDDLVKSGGTLVACFRALLKQGVARVHFYITHGQFCGDSVARFIALRDEFPNHFGFFYTSDSFDNSALRKDLFRQISIAPLCAQLIRGPVQRYKSQIF